MRLAQCAGLVAASAILGGCANLGGGASDDTVTVLAASSLDVALEGIVADFEAATELTVRVSTGGSSSLVEQAIQGGAFDVLIVADEVQAERARSAGVVTASEVIASNTLELAVPAANPAGITTWEEMDRASALVICAPAVPCGRSAQSFADAANRTLEPVSEELSVRDVLAKVTSGDADAGLVFHSDVVTSGEVVGIPLPGNMVEPNVYQALLPAKPRPVAKSFMTHLLSESSRGHLVEAGFELSP